MTRRIEFSARAGAGLDRLEAFIATESRGRAERAIARLLRGIDQLTDFPELGVAVGEGLRQLVLKYGKSGHIVRYCVLGDVIFITRIWHGRENRPR